MRRWSGNIFAKGFNKDLILQNVISTSIAILEREENLLEVWLSDDDSREKNVSSWALLPQKSERGPVWFRQVYSSKDTSYGISKLTGSLKHRKRLQKLGHLDDIPKMMGFLQDNGDGVRGLEYLYSAKASSMGYSSAQLCLSKKGPWDPTTDIECAMDIEKLKDPSTTGIMWKQQLL
jgi:hypothetical protein